MSLPDLCTLIERKISDEAFYIEENTKNMKEMMPHCETFDRKEATKQIRHAIDAFRKSPDYQHAEKHVKQQLDDLAEIISYWKPTKERDNWLEIKLCLLMFEMSHLMRSQDR